MASPEKIKNPSMQALKKVKARQEREKSQRNTEAPPVHVTAAKAAKLGNDKPLFYSPDGTDIRVALPDGRVAIVGELPRELPRSFYKAAHAAGCYSTNQINPKEYNIPTTPDEDDPEKRTLKIRALVLEAAQAEEDDPAFEGAFTPAGLPNVLWLSQKLGFAVGQQERDSAWNQIKAEIESNDEVDQEEADEA